MLRDVPRGGRLFRVDDDVVFVVVRQRGVWVVDMNEVAASAVVPFWCARMTAIDRTQRSLFVSCADAHGGSVERFSR